MPRKFKPFPAAGRRPRGMHALASLGVPGCSQSSGCPAWLSLARRGAASVETAPGGFSWAGLVYPAAVGGREGWKRPGWERGILFILLK